MAPVTEEPSKVLVLIFFNSYSFHSSASAPSLVPFLIESHLLGTVDSSLGTIGTFVYVCLLMHSVSNSILFYMAIFLLIMYMCVCLHWGMYILSALAGKARRGWRNPGVMGSCEPTDLGAENKLSCTLN